MEASSIGLFRSAWQHLSSLAKRALFHPNAAWFVLLLSLMLTAAGWYVSNKYVTQRAEEAFQFEVEQARLAIIKRMQEYELMLRGGVALFNASVHVDRQEWKRYVETLEMDRYYPGVQGLGFARWISRQERSDVIDSVRREGYSEFNIWPDTDQPFLTSILYLEPFSGRNLRAFGYDMFSEAKRRRAMETARDTGETAISEKVILVQETNQDIQAGFLMYIPVYRSGASLANVADRREALTGFVYSPFRIQDLMVGILRRSSIQVDFEIYDGDEVSQDALLYRSWQGAAVSEGDYKTTARLQLPSRQWTLQFKTYGNVDRKIFSPLPTAVAAAGLVFDALLFYIVWSIANQRRNIHRQAEAMTAELAHERLFLGALIDSLSETIIAFDADGRLAFVNPAASVMLKFNLQNVPVSDWSSYVTVFQADGITRVDFFNAVLNSLRKGETLQEAEFGIELPDARRINVLVNGQPLVDAHGRSHGVMLVIRDVTHDKQTLRLKESEERFRSVFEAAPSAMIIVNSDGVVQLMNLQAERLFGYARNELAGRSIEALLPAAHRQQHAYYRSHYQQRPEPRRMGESRDLYGMAKSGVRIPIEVGLSPINTTQSKMVLAVVVDISQRKETERVLLQSIQEKETLLREIHHRVKNNMQVITSLLNLQATHSGNEVLRNELLECQMRIKTMALIHQLLYEHQDFSRIHVQEYIERLVKLISAGYSSSRVKVKLVFEMPEDRVYLDLNRAIPCGLIVNEVVTNSFKHAFTDLGEGVLLIKLTRLEDSLAMLTVQDNGRGLPPDFDPDAGGSLGLQLVTLLTEQLGGKLSIVGEQGTRVDITFTAVSMSRA